ncbi:hypothetical protein Bbelb_184660 [Branchiostoma belcheri]|nr:hypothetical protein Bbelb_184660 [Branchiostoma belcheri]
MKLGSEREAGRLGGPFFGLPSWPCLSQQVWFSWRGEPLCRPDVVDRVLCDIGGMGRAAQVNTHGPTNSPGVSSAYVTNFYSFYPLLVEACFWSGETARHRLFTSIPEDGGLGHFPPGFTVSRSSNGPECSQHEKPERSHIRTEGQGQVQARNTPPPNPLDTPLPASVMTWMLTQNTSRLSLNSQQKASLFLQVVATEVFKLFALASGDS